MGESHRLWPALEDIPGAEAVLAEWQFRLDCDFDSVRSLLLPTDKEASSYPNFAGDFLPSRIAKHGPDDFAAVHTASGEITCLKRQAVLIYRLNRRKLATEVTSALGFSAVFEEVPSPAVTHRVGSAERSDGTYAPVHLIVPAEPSELHGAIEAIASRGRETGIVIAPTRRCFKPASEKVLHETKGQFITLEHALVARDGEKWTINSRAIESLAAYLNPATAIAEEPLGERSKLVLIAMLELDAVDADRLRSTEEIAPKALGADADANSLKSVMADLNTRKLIDSKTGRGGGCWLTATGIVRAKKLQGP